MRIKMMSGLSRPAVVLGSVMGLAGLVALAPAQAAIGDSSGLNTSAAALHDAARQPSLSPSMMSATKVADSDSDQTGSPSATKEQKAKRTNQTTGAPDKNPGHLSDQKGNQPKSAVKTN